MSNNAKPHTFSQKFKQFQYDESGSELIEFALSSVVVLAVIFGIMDCSRAIYIDHFLASAARSATRYAMLHGATWTSSCASYSALGCKASSTNVSDYVGSQAGPGILPANITVNTTWPGTNANGGSCTSSGTANLQGCVVNVQVSYAFSFILPFLPTGPLTMSSVSAATILE